MVLLNEVRQYVENEIKKGNFPSYALLNKKFRISKNKITLKDIYLPLKINLLEIWISEMPMSEDWKLSGKL